MRNLTAAIPIYITRKNDKGEIGSYYIAIWFALLALLLLSVNLTLWGIVGIIQAIGVLF